MTGLGRVVRTGGRVASVAVRGAAARSPEHVVRTTRVDPTWRRIEDGRAARLGPDRTIDVARRVGHWRTVDPRRPRPISGVGAKLVAVTVWAGAVGAAWWIGARRRRGPLAAVADLDQFGSAVTAALDAFADDTP